MHHRRNDVVFDVDNDNPTSGNPPKKIVKIYNNKQNNNNKIKIYTTSNKTSVITLLEATAIVTVIINVKRDTSYNRFFTAIKRKQLANLVADIVVLIIVGLFTKLPYNTLLLLLYLST